MSEIKACANALLTRVFSQGRVRSQERFSLLRDTPSFFSGFPFFLFNFRWLRNDELKNLTG
jgi:hypothetical protein